jgi:seryl-tRNA synthetase
MLDIQFIRENQEAVAAAIRNKNVKLDIEALLTKDHERLVLLQEIETLKAQKNAVNTLIQKAVSPEDREAAITEGKRVKALLDEKEPAYAEAKQSYDGLMALVPNIPSEDTPIGKDESGNVVIRTVGEPTRFDFTPKEHFELGADLDIIDTERAVKVSGARFAYLKGDLVLLEFSIVQLVMSILTNEEKLKKIIADAGLNVPSKPFVPVIPPVFIKPEPFERMARLRPEEDKYHIPGDDLYLVGSAEHTLGSMYMDETLVASDLPIRYIGFSTAFRREAGSYGKDMKGILRVHQFDKLEMESFTTSEQSLEEQNFFVAIQEHIVQSLGIPYQVVQICTGDMGKPDVRQIDIECWLPGQGKYRETHTSDLMTDFQSRRLNTKVKREDGTVELVHMNDATAAAGRILIAILENYQQEDGSVVIPEVLRPYVGKDRIESRNREQ